MVRRMKVPCCSVCHTRYNEDERVPLLLQCGHGFCKDCLSKMFSSSSDTTLTCPRCRHVSVVGNSVQGLRKNFAMLALIDSASGGDNFDYTDDEDDAELLSGDAELLSGFEVGDWVRSKPSLGTRPSYDWFSVGRENIAVVHSIQEAGYLELACCFRKGRWSTHYTDLEKIPALKIGQFVHFQNGLTEPRWGWRGAKPDSRGIIASVHADGEVRVAFFGLPGLWRGDPADLEVERMFEVGEWVRLKEGVRSWKSIGPASVGVVQGVGYEGDEWDGTTSVSFCGEQERWSGHSHGSVGTIAAIDGDGKLRIYTPAGSKTWLLDPAEVETIEEEKLKIGDWVRVKPCITTPSYQWGEVNPSSIGVVHRMEDGDLWVSFCFLDRLWLCKAGEMERIRPFGIGDRVKIKNGLVTPRWGWGMETHASKGHVVGVDANGKLRIKFLWREGRPWIGDPADIVLDEPSG